MRRWSLHLRLAAAGAAAVLAALALAGFGLSLLFEAHVTRRAVAELSVELDQVLAGLGRDADGTLTLATRPADPRFERPLGGLYWQIESGGRTLRSRSLWDATLPMPADDLIDGAPHVHRIAGPGAAPLLALERMVTLPPRLGGEVARITVAMDEDELAKASRDFARDMAPYLGLLALVLIVAGWAQLAVGLRPLATVGARVAAVRSGRSARLGADFPAEVRPLAAEVDALIAAREADIVRARARAGDLAHGLKTPLQALLGEAGRLRADGRAMDADAIEEIAGAMTAHVDRELARARIAARGAAGRAEIAATVARVVSVVRRTPAGKRLDWALPDGSAAARIDADDLTEALGALIENAARHATARVEIAVEPRGTMVAVLIRDDGPGIPAERIAGLTRRGARLDTAGPGAGLGISIASEIAEAAGGALRLANRTDRPAAGEPPDSVRGGLEASLTLPAAD